jgi:hypothetical protein
MQHILDHLGVLEAAVLEIAGRLDHSRVAVAHSMGGHTVGLLVGAQLLYEDGTQVNLAKPRIRAWVLLAAPGNGETNLSAYATELLPFLRHPNFVETTTPTPTLVILGDKDVLPHLAVRGSDWHADPYFLSTGPKSLLTIFGGEHALGGISGYDAPETTNENLSV